MMEEDELPLRGRGGEGVLEPLSLRRVLAGSVGLVAVAVDDEHLDIPLHGGVIALVTGQGEVIGVGLVSLAGVVVVVADGGEELVRRRPSAIGAAVVPDEGVVPLPDVG